MYKVEFKGLAGVLKKISVILGLSFWELLMSLPHGTPGGIYLILDFAPRLLGLSCDYYIQSQRASPSLTPYIGITILLTQLSQLASTCYRISDSWKGEGVIRVSIAFLTDFLHPEHSLLESRCVSTSWTVFSSVANFVVVANLYLAYL